jgi:hypothetical protein
MPRKTSFKRGKSGRAAGGAIPAASRASIATTNSFA